MVIDVNNVFCFSNQRLVFKQENCTKFNNHNALPFFVVFVLHLGHASTINGKYLINEF